MARIIWAEAARHDLAALLDYVSERSVENAVALLDRLERAASSLNTLPRRGRVVPELAAVHVHVYRELIVGPYRLIYRIDKESRVLVMAVLDGRRDLGDLLLLRLLRA